MKYQKLSNTDAFIVFDFDDVPSVGITRLARKILRDGAELLARSTTYSFATFELRMCGASAGINAEGEDRDPAVASFVDEVKELVASGRWATDPGLGLTDDDLAPLRIDDRRPPELWMEGFSDTLTARGAVAAAGAVRGGDISGARCAIAGTGPVTETAERAIQEEGGSLVEGGVDAECDVLFVAGKTGMVDHEVAETVQAGIIVPLTPVPITARGHAVLSQAGRVHVPDFLSIAAPLLHAHAVDAPDPIERVAGSVSEIASTGAGLWMAAVERAEAFMRTWCDELPFGRPLA